MRNAPQSEGLKRSITAATLRERDVLHLEWVPIEPHKARALYAAIVRREALETSPPRRESVFFWHTPEQWMIGLGASETSFASPGQDRFDAMREHTARWRESVAHDPRAEECVMVGGFAFDHAHQQDEDTYWRGYESVAFWIPELLIRWDGARHEAMLATRVSPGEMEHALGERVEASCAALDALLDEAADVSLDEAARGAAGIFEEPAASAWSDLVGDAVETMVAGDFEKVVLARAIDYLHDEPIDTASVLARLLTKYAGCKVFAIRPPCDDAATSPASFLGATPECLVRLDRGGELYVDALAGTSSASEPDDVLLSSEKDRLEHQLVIDAIRESLDDVASLDVPDTPTVDALANVKHLRTPIRGALLRREGLLSLAARLHPTPAVCGRPRERAREWILNRERPLGMTRGWYAGAIGWMALSGEGELDVALRCALIDAERARLFVGAGILKGSRAESELEETALKGRALASALVASQGAHA